MAQSSTHFKTQDNDIKLKSLISNLKETALQIDTNTNGGETDHVTSLIMIEEEIDALY